MKASGKTSMSGLVLLFLWYVGGCHGLPFGAPVQACADLTPRKMDMLGHHAESMTTKAPYLLTWKRDLLNTNTYLITLSGVDKAEFRGFLIQVRNSQDLPYGDFIDLDYESKHLNCGSEYDTVTHIDNTLKQSVTLTWTEGEIGQQPEKLIATVVQDANTYWTGIKGEVWENRDS